MTWVGAVRLPRALPGLAALLLSLSLFAGIAVVPARAASTLCIRIIAGVFDPAGDDNVMPVLNNEYVVLRNYCSSRVDLGSWSIHDYGRANTYRFAATFSLGPGASVTLRSGTGTNTAATLYWQRRSVEVWSNVTWERAYLRDPSGALRFNWSWYADRVLIGAGDIASCSTSGDTATANLLDVTRGTVVTLGDNAYVNGTSAEFANCYGPTWGRHRARTKPSVGNHEYGTANAAGYFGYFGSLAGAPSQGYYSYDRGAWHVIVLNSNCAQVGGCGVGSPQEAWLREDLAANPTSCTVAYWHHPKFSSGRYGDRNGFAAFWKALYDYRAELVLNGHDHLYERFAPQTPNGRLDLAGGVRQFTVGTGGYFHHTIVSIIPNSQVRNSRTFGVLRLDLATSSYRWKFQPISGFTFTDSGSATCH